MTTTFKNNIKFAMATISIAACGFWFNMERYQKDRVATVIVRSVESVVTQGSEPEQLETLENKEVLNSSVSEY
ncbi:hypothetical protein [Pontixanthobacter sp. CEM42]|uniref:hypothetical protein n=1 Tax=Pontixanthobacter sp. CEM42 TaxID=2792077 RepID=UPI001ADFA5E8|nr:hypothetical protein [Pontixanthobacter sp. CEM42]